MEEWLDPNTLEEWVRTVLNVTVSLHHNTLYYTSTRLHHTMLESIH